jgi:hypothetical protein
MLYRHQRAFTLMETLIGVGLFLMIMVGVYQGYFAVVEAARAATVRLTAANLANEQFEIVRNLPYSDVGVVSGVPSGKIPLTQTLIRGGYTFTVTAAVRNIDLPFDGTIGGNPNDLSPADNKLVEFTISCELCTNFLPLSFTGRVAPRNLETASTNGALFVEVFNASGVEVPGASVHIESTIQTPAIDIQDTTNNSGILQIVDIPPGYEEYKITVTKDGYSTSTTYPSGAPENPNPTHPHATVVLQNVTQTAFEIDELSTLFISSVTDTCSTVPDADFSITGLTKFIGEDPDIPKYNVSRTTDGNGQATLGSVEYDTYLVELEDEVYDLIGSSPLIPFLLVPGSVQNLQLVIVPKNPKSLMVTVKDAATELPISNATVLLEGPSYSESLVTGRGFLTQTDWSGGGGQILFVDNNKYFTSDGNIDISNPAGTISLKQIFGEYATSGWIESSTFDTGSESNFYNITWVPQDQPPQAGENSLRFQIATGNDAATTTWNYLGPDGTASTYYTIVDSNISSVHNGDRYLRYKIYFQTENTDLTPSVSDVSFTFTSECTPPGQVLFGGLSSGAYTATVSKTGYQDSAVEDISVSTPWQQAEVTMYPE